MKKSILLIVTIFSLFSLFGQDKKGLKAQQKALEKLEERIPFPALDVIDNSGKLLYKNQPLTSDFKEVSISYTAKIETLEPYFVSTLYPLFNVGQIKTDVGQSFVYFPLILVNFDKSDGIPHGKYKFVVPDGAKLKTAYSFDTENGPAIMMEFYKSDDYTYSYGLILEEKLKNLMGRVEKKEIGLMTDSRDSRIYKWVKIGKQTWFGENLQYDLGDRKLVDGKSVYSNYNGRYYNFSQATSACPKGWHLPSDGEWKELELEIGLNPEFLDTSGVTISRGGINDKTPGTDLKTSEELMFFARYAGTMGKEKYGFKLYQKNKSGYYWTSSKADESKALNRIIGSDFDGIVRDKAHTQINYFSCRCVENRDLTSMIENSSKLIEITAKITASPAEAGNYFDRSIEFFLNGEANLALDDINKAIELDGNDLDQKLFKAQIMFINSFDKDAGEIRQLVAEYTAVNNDNDFAYFFECRLALYDYDNGVLKATSDNERIKKGLVLIQKALVIDPNNPYYNDYRARILIKLGEYKDAITALYKQLEVDTKNGEAYYFLGLMKLRYHNQENRDNKVKAASEWCTQIGGACFKITSTELKEVCRDFTKAINYGATINPDYMSLCGELKQAETLEKHKPIVYTGPRGGRYTMSSGGSKVYIPRR